MFIILDIICKTGWNLTNFLAPLRMKEKREYYEGKCLKVHYTMTI